MQKTVEVSQHCGGGREGAEGVHNICKMFSSKAKVRGSFRERECVIECRVLCHSLRKEAQMRWAAFSSDFMPGCTQTHAHTNHTNRLGMKNTAAANARYSLFFFVSPSLRHATDLFM